MGRRGLQPTNRPKPCHGKWPFSTRGLWEVMAGAPPVDPRRLKISAAKPYCYAIMPLQHVGKAADSGHHVYFAQPVAL
ncbi:hypothetical protein Pyn_19687 [Prunus yedoensis var. nudiflora]|uniref:Uncharacterized protein n=1 Tax=Prunus yedoensis var. nudiflora TaxID=2094558 RepID=A0A314UH96_PRUYE|nr:hypothetical protein Pyn_19687 [Prunus yedoensis var. nudiflora]